MSHWYDEWVRSEKLLVEIQEFEEKRQEQEEQGQRRGWWVSVLGLLIVWWVRVSAAELSPVTRTMMAIVVGLLSVCLWFGDSPADLLREIREDRNPVDLILGMVVISFVVGSFVMMAVFR